MREQLIQYVNLLFAGAADCEEVKQEILQNTLDRYDDLLEQGKQPEAAYRLAISGIGDINEILSSTPQTGTPISPQIKDTDSQENKQRRAAAVAMYILCPIPLFILSEIGHDTIGLCMTLALVAAATALMILTKRKEAPAPRTETKYEPQSPKSDLHSSVKGLIWAVGLALYFILSFTTQAWHITWLLFPIIAAVQGLVGACIDLKEANQNER